jgi:hypothetical protein
MPRKCRASFIALLLASKRPDMRIGLAIDRLGPADTIIIAALLEVSERAPPPGFIATGDFLASAARAPTAIASAEVTQRPRQEGSEEGARMEAVQAQGVAGIVVETLAADGAAAMAAVAAVIDKVLSL